MFNKMLSKKQKTLLLSLLLIFVIGTGVTIAYIVTNTSGVTNTFLPSQVTCSVEEDFTINGKKDVAIKNTSMIPAFIRAEVIVTWKNDAGEIYGVTPELGENGDYTIEYDLENGWQPGKDGYYYYNGLVKPGDETGALIKRANVTSVADVPVGYYLNVEIIASAIQAEGVSSSDETGGAGKAPAEIAWSNDKVTVTVDGDKLSIINK